MLNVDLGIRDGVRTSRGALSRRSPHAGYCYPSLRPTYRPFLFLSRSASVRLLPFRLLPVTGSGARALVLRNVEERRRERFPRINGLTQVRNLNFSRCAG